MVITNKIIFILLSIFTLSLIVTILTINTIKPDKEPTDVFLKSSTDLRNKRNHQSSDYQQRINNIEELLAKNSTVQKQIIASLNKIIETGASEPSNTTLDTEKETAIPVPTLASIIEKEQQFVDEIESNFQQEEKDASWSVNEETKIRDILQQQGLNQAVVNNIDCRSKTCRANVGHQHREGAELFLDSFIDSLPDTAGEIIFKDDGNGVSIL